MVCFSCVEIARAACYTNVTVAWNVSGFPAGCNSFNLIGIQANGITVANVDPRVSTSGSHLFTGSWCDNLGARAVQQAGGSCGPTSLQTTEYQYPSAHNSTITVNFTWNGGQEQDQTPPQCLKFNVNNQSDFSQLYRLLVGGVSQGTLPVAGHNTGTFTYCPVNGLPVAYSVEKSNGDGTWSGVGNGGNDGSGGWGPSPGGGTSPPTYVSNPLLGTNAPPSNLEFPEGTAPNDLAKESTLRAFANQMNSVLNQGFQGVMNRQDAQSSKLDTQTAQDAARNTKLDSINSSLGTVNNSIGTANSHLSGISSAIGNVNNNSAAANTKLDGVNTRLDTANNKLNSIDIGVGGNNTRLDGVNTRLDTSNQKLTTLNTSADALNVHVADMKTLQANQIANDLFIEQHTEDSKNLLQNNISPTLGNIAQYTLDARTILGNIRDNTASTVTHADALNQKAAQGNVILAQIETAVETLAAAPTSVDPRPNIDGVKTSVDTVNQSVLAVKNSIDTLADPRPNIDAFHDTFKSYTNMHGPPEGLVGIATDLISNPGDFAGGMRSLGEAAAVSSMSAAGVTAFKTALENVVPANPGNGAASLELFVVNAGGYTFDMNPMRISGFSSLAAMVKTFLTWAITIAYFLAVWREVHQYIRAMPMVNQTQSPQVDILGNSAGTLAGIPYAAIMTVVLLTVPSACIAILSNGNLLGRLGENPLEAWAANAGPVGAGYTLAAHFIPFGVLFANLVLYFVSTFAIGAVFLVASIVIRYFVASVAFAGLVFGVGDVQAGEIEFHNLSGQVLQWKSGDVVWKLPAGVVTEFYWPDEVSPLVGVSDADSLTLTIGSEGLYRVMAGWHNVSNSVVLEVEIGQSKQEWFTAGFSVGLVMFGWGFIMRIVRKVSNHAPDV